MIVRAAFAVLGLAAAALPASALDRTPSDSVKSCPQSGPDALLIPGTSTCIKLSGRVTTDVTGGSRRVSRDGTATGFGATGRVAVDTRTETEYGPVRGYVRLRAGQGTTPRN